MVYKVLKHFNYVVSEYLPMICNYFLNGIKPLNNCIVLSK